MGLTVLKLGDFRMILNEMVGSLPKPWHECLPITNIQLTIGQWHGHAQVNGLFALCQILLSIYPGNIHGQGGHPWPNLKINDYISSL
jgi:hypothetical protein